MLCPLRLVKNSETDFVEFGECEEGNCAWYNTANHKCAVYEIPMWISAITQR